MSGHGEVLQQAAFDAIEDNGEPIVFKRTTTGTFDPVSGEDAGGVTTQFTRMAIVSKASGSVVSSFDNRFENGTLIETNLRAIVVAGLDLTFDPMPGDVAVFDGCDWTVLGSTPERAEGLNITFSLTVRR